ncbi:MAG: hypothetical protein ACOYNI_07650 [Acidimicrobiia bacterium]
MGFEIFTNLDIDWQIVAASPAAQTACRRWGTDPALRGCRTPDDVLARTDRRYGAAAADAVLAALARRAGTDTMAARTLLQALVPGMVSLARRHGAPIVPDAADHVVAIALERIRTYPFDRRPRAIAANVLLDTHQRMCRQRAESRETFGHDLTEIPAIETANAAHDVIDLVAAAVERAVIDADDAALVLAPVMGDDDFSERAADDGVKPRSIARRRQRAMRRVVAFARDELSA